MLTETFNFNYFINSIKNNDYYCSFLIKSKTKKKKKKTRQSERITQKSRKGFWPNCWNGIARTKGEPLKMLNDIVNNYNFIEKQH